jgi:hypothetical protein
VPGAADRGRQGKRSRRAGRMLASPIADPFPSCLYCGKGVSRDELVVVVEHDGESGKHRSREPALAQRAGALLVRACCAPIGSAGAG